MQRVAPKHIFLFLEESPLGGEDTLQQIEDAMALECSHWNAPSFAAILVTPNTKYQFATVGSRETGFMTPKRGTCIDFGAEHFVLSLH